MGTVRQAPHPRSGVLVIYRQLWRRLGAFVAAVAEAAPVAAVLALVAAIGSLLMQQGMMPASRLYTGRGRYIATSDELMMEVEHVVTRYGWAAFERMGESAEHFFLIRIALRGAAIIP